MWEIKWVLTISIIIIIIIIHLSYHIVHYSKKG